MSAEIIPFRVHRRCRMNHAARIAFLERGTSVTPPPTSPTWADFWIDATYNNFRYFSSAAAELVK